MKAFRTLLISVAYLASHSGISQANYQDGYLLFYLGGQSNMNGFGYIEDLPDSLNKTFEEVYIYQGNPVGDGEKGGGLGRWEPLRPGHGADFSSDGIANKHSNRFGLELSLAARLKEYYPNKKIAFIKYARPGSGIDSMAQGNFGTWDPDFKGNRGIDQYDHFLTTLNGAFSDPDIDGDGKPDILDPTGIFWMQGESDASFTEEIASRYYENLKRLIDLIRASMRTDDLPVVIGKISDSRKDEKDGRVWDFGELVEYAQEKFVKEDGHAAIVRNARFYGFSDPWHYDSQGYIDLGAAFGNAMAGLLTR